MDLDARARQRRAELWLGIAWYSFSAVITVAMTTVNSALSVLPGFEVYALWAGRFALLPFFSALAGFAFLVREPMRTRRVVDELLEPPVSLRESLLVIAVALALPVVVWAVRPGIGPGILGLALLWGVPPLLWSVFRARSAAWRWLLGMALYGGLNGVVLLGLRWWFGPMDRIHGPDLDLLLLGVGAVAATGVLFGTAMMLLVGWGFFQVDRAFDRGDLETVASTSFGGLLDDHILVLDALRREGRVEEVVDRFRHAVAVAPFVGNSLAVVARALHDVGDPRARGLAEAAVQAQPTSPAALLTLGLVYLDLDPSVTLDAVQAAESRALGGSSRMPVFRALELAALHALGRDVRAEVARFEPVEHPIHAVDAASLLARCAPDPEVEASVDGGRRVPATT